MHASPRRLAPWTARLRVAWGIALLALGLVACAPEHPEVSEQVQLVLNADALASTSTFEVRFQEAVAGAEQVGQAAEPSPLIIRPSLKGRFTWLSRHSGVFQPEEPLALDTRYILTLRPGLKTRAGAPVTARLHRLLRTPAFEVHEVSGREFSSASVPLRPELGLYFNADVRAFQAQAYLEFRDRSGQRVPALATQATGRDRGFVSEGDASRTTWKQPFFPGSNSPAPRTRHGRSSSGDTRSAAPVLNGLIVVPETDLPMGSDWKLVVREGLPAAERGLRLASAHEFQIGSVVPFGLRSVQAHNGVRDGKRIALQFNKRLPADLTAANLREWISLRPVPTNLVLQPEWSSVELRGDFSLDQGYTLTVRAGFPSSDGFSLAATYATNLHFTPVAPRLYFPATETSQMLGGRREFELLAVNTGPIRVRAKQLDRATLVHALRGYQTYQKQNDGIWDYQEPYREVDFRAVPGRTIYEADLGFTNRTDEPQRCALKWDDILGAGRPGAVFLAAEQVPEESRRRARQGTQALVQLTDLGLAWKLSDADAFLFVFSHATGLPVSNATVRLLTDESETLAEKTTDASGLARLPLSTNAVWVLAESGPDLHAAALSENPVYLYGYGVRTEGQGDSKDDLRVFLFSDRAVYRPGETLHLKGVVRAWGPSGSSAFAIPAGLSGTLQLVDPKQDTVFETNVIVSAAGSLTQSIVLPEGVRGQHHVVLGFGSREYHHFVQVQELQPNAFSIVLGTRPAYLASEAVRVPVAANYYLGAPLSRAQVRWSLEAEDKGFEPEGFEDFQFCTPWLDHRLGRNRSSFATHGEASYSTNLTIAPDLPLNPVAPQPRAVHFRVEITDLNQQTIARADDFARHSSEFYLGIKRLRDVCRAGEPLVAEIIAVKPDGQPLAQPAAITLTVQRLTYQTVRVQGAGRAVTYRSELSLSNVLTQALQTLPLRKVGTRWEVLPGPAATPPLVLPEPGQYLIEARARDSGGREVVTVSSLYLFGPQEMAWPYRNDSQLELIPDKPRYLAGETATLLAKAPVSGRALVTVERETVLRSFVAELRGNAPAIPVPIEEGDAPNVFVSVLLVRGSSASPKKVKVPEHRLGYCELRVENPRTKLDVRLLAGAADYRPGQAGTVVAEVRDSAGRSVPDAEVTLYAMDEGILSLTGEATPDPHAFFFRPRPLGVQCGLTLPSLLSEDPERLVFANKGYLVGGGGRERLRKDFLPCAFWQAALVTDAGGKVAARFTVPDSLTRYRVIAVAHTRQSQFGSGQSQFEVNKPLLVEPALPRFANITDRILARAVVHNRTDAPGAVEVTLQLDDKAAADVPAMESAQAPLTPSLSPTGGEGVRRTGAGERVTQVHQPGLPAARLLTQRIPVKARSSAPVEFPLVLAEPGPAQWIWTVRFADAPKNSEPGTRNPEPPPFTDSVLSTLPVGHVAPLLRETYLARTESGETNLLAGANPQLLEGTGTATVQISNTRLGELGEAVSQLLHYPYGCVEQTGSSLLPWIVLRNAPGVGPQVGRSPSEVESAARAGIQRLLSMQTPGGGLAYWPGGREPMFWGSAYGGMILVLARRGGWSVAETPFERLLNYLGAQLRGSAEAAGDFSARCLAVYTLALAGRAEAAYHEVLGKRQDRLSPENRALLALAILESEGPPSMAGQLLRPGGITVESDDWFGGGSRQLAVQLLAWSRYRPTDPAVDTFAAELTQGRRHGHWTTTQGNAWALYALTDYARRVEGRLNAAQGTLARAGRTEPFDLKETASRVEQRFPLSAETQGAPLLLANPGQRRLYTQVRLEVRSASTRPPRQDRGFAVRRTYAKLDDDGVPRELRDLRVGDRVLVTLEVQVHQPAHYVAVDDPLPALFEALNPEFKSQETGRLASLPGDGFDWFSDFRELRNDRALFFRDHLAPGRYRIRYLARVRAAGTATAPAAKAEEMYHPERFGLSETWQVSSRPLE